MEGEVQSLLKEGLLSNVMAQLRSLPRSQPPKALDRAGMAGWAEASSLEACLLLDILILIASCNGCRAGDILDIITLIQVPFLELFFGFTPSPPSLSSSPYSTPPSSSSSPSSPSVSLASLAISAAAESLLSTALHRAVLLLIVAVDVDGVVVALARGMQFSVSLRGSPACSLPLLLPKERRLVHMCFLSCPLPPCSRTHVLFLPASSFANSTSQHPLSSPSDLSQVDQRLSAWLSCLLSAASAKGGASGRGEREEFGSGVGMAEEGIEEGFGGGAGGERGLTGLNAVLPLVGATGSADARSDMSPVLLAWGLLHMLLQWLPDSSHLPAPALNPGLCVQAAYAAGALDWVLFSLLSSSLPTHPSSDPVMQGVLRRCVKGLCTAYLTAFDISNQKGTRLYALLLEIICRTFSEQESLCTEFWDASASPSDAPLRSLLAATRRDFPARPLPFLRLLSALSHGSWPARCTFEFLESTMGAALLLPLPPACASLSALSAPQPLLLPGCGGLLLPTGARGEVVEQENGLSLVHFEVPLSALLILLFRLVHRAQQDQDASPADISASVAGVGEGEEAAEELSVGLSLLSHLLSANQACVGALLHLQSSPLITSASANGLLPRGMTLDPTALITAILDGLLSSPALSAPSSSFSSSSSSPSSSSSTSHSPSAAVSLTSAACCLRILAAFALLHPERVAAALSSSIFSPSALSSDLQLQSGPATSPLHLLCFQIEQPLGSFPFTLAALDLAAALVKQGVTGGPVPDLLGFAVMDVMPNYGAWRMEEGRERWHMAGKLSRLLSLTLSLAPWAASSLLRSTHSLLEGGSGQGGGDNWEEEEEEQEEKEVREERGEYMRREGWQEEAGAYKRSRVGVGMWSSSSSSSAGGSSSSSFSGGGSGSSETFNPYSSSAPSAPPAPPSSPSTASALASKLLHLLLTDARISAALLAPLQSALLMLQCRASQEGSEESHTCAEESVLGSESSEQSAALHHGLELLTVCIRLKPFCHAAADAPLSPLESLLLSSSARLPWHLMPLTPSAPALDSAGAAADAALARAAAAGGGGGGGGEGPRATMGLDSVPLVTALAALTSLGQSQVCGFWRCADFADSFEAPQKSSLEVPQCSMLNAQCTMLNPQCTMLNAQCTMHNAQCTMHNAQCSMHNAQCSMHNAQCSMLNAQCSMHNAQCTMHNAQCSMHNAQCSMLNAQCTMHNAQCSMHNAQCTMHNAQCSMLNAQCTMLNAQCSMLNAQCTMLNAQCTMLNAQCTMHNAQCTMLNAQCTMLNAQCSMLNAQCTMLNAQCSMLNAQCSMLNAQCTMLNAQCSMLNAQCSMLNAHCTMLNAQCTMLNAQCSMHNAQCSMLNAQCSMLNAQCSMLTAHCTF
ncbi:unnamed protein product [Closterium sp. NIES-54]